MCVEKYNLAQYSSIGVPWNPSVPQNQWRILGMAGMARAMGATFSRAQKLLGTNKNFYLRFLEPLFCAAHNHKWRSYAAHPYLTY